MWVGSCIAQCTESHREEAEYQRLGIVRLGLFGGTCHFASGVRSNVQSLVLAFTSHSKPLCAQGPVAKHTASTGETVAASGRQLSHADVIAACTGVKAAQPVKWAAAQVDFWVL
jgi:hypothetical protein